MSIKNEKQLRNYRQLNETEYEVDKKADSYIITKNSKETGI